MLLLVLYYKWEAVVAGVLEWSALNYFHCLHWEGIYELPLPPTPAGVWLLNPQGLLLIWLHLCAAGHLCRTTLIRDQIMNFPVRPEA